MLDFPFFRLASSPLVTLEGHQKGVMSISWCKQDPDLLLSAGKDGRVLCWNPNNTKPVSWLFVIHDICKLINVVFINVFIYSGWRATHRDKPAATVGVRRVVVRPRPRTVRHRLLRRAGRRALATGACTHRVCEYITQFTCKRNKPATVGVPRGVLYFFGTRT